MVEIAGRTLIERQCGALRAGGVAEIAVVRGYRGDTIQADGVTFIDNPRWDAANMVGSLLCARDWLSGGGIVSYGDIFYPDSAVTALTAARGDVAITYDPDWLELWQMRFDDPLTDAETFSTDERGNLTKIGGRATTVDEIQGQFMGLLKFTAEGWRNIAKHLYTKTDAERDRLDTTAMLSELVSEGWEILTVPVAGPWSEVDTVRDIEVAERVLERFTTP
jgi:choline kinase